MKRASFIIMAMLMGSYIALAQTGGTAESAGWTGGREIVANGLTPLFSATGNYSISADGAGSYDPYLIRVNKPSPVATVFKAYLMAASTGFSGFNIPNGCMTLNGLPINWNVTIPNSISSYNHYADVTGIIAAIINPAGAGITNLTVTECNYADIDGIALLVVFADPAAPQKTVVIMFGALSTAGDNFALTLGTPIDPAAPGATLDMGLGISFGWELTGQFSIIDINTVRLTSSAGGYDDWTGSNLWNGALMTVGGIGDVNANPPDPYLSDTPTRYDDELYSLLPFITNTTTNILVNTVNPSNDDNIFMAYFEISGAAIIGEGILLTQDEDINMVGTDHTVTALVQDVLGNPVVGTMVDFTVLSGPNAGVTYSELTDASGNAFFTYAGTGGPGTDEIQACFTDSQLVYQCSNILYKTWIINPDVPVSNWAIILGIMLIFGALALRYRRLI
jgi:hypothetical protein